MNDTDAFLVALKHLAGEEKRGFQQRISAGSGLTDPYISNLVNGKKSNPSEGAKRKIATAIGISVSEMVRLGMKLSGKPEKAPPALSVVPARTDLDDLPEPEIRNLLHMTEDVLRSKTQFREALKENIKSFHYAVDCVDDLKSLKGVVKEHEGTISEMKEEIKQLQAKLLDGG